MIDARQFLCGELRAPRSLQVARGTSRFALVASRAGNFALRARCKSRGELRAPRSLQVARGTSRFALVQCTARMPCRILAKRLRIFAMQKYGSERCTDAARTATARNLIGSRESKNGRAIFLLLETLGNSCAGNFALRARCKLRGELRASRSFNARHGCRVVSWQSGCVFLLCKNTVVSGLSQKSVTFSTAYEFKIKSLHRTDLILNIA